MWKTGLIALVLLGFAWSYPPTRAKMANGMAPMLERLGPVGDRLLEPAQRYDARNEVDFIIDQIELAKTEGHTIPDTRTFEKWLRRWVTTRRDGKDPWGERYYLVTVSGTLTVGSMGPDAERNTADDIKKSMRI